MISTTVRSPDRLFALVTEFAQLARTRRAEVEAAIRRHLEAELALHGAAGVELATRPPDAEQAMQEGATYRERMAVSEPGTPTLDEKITYLARVHDLVVAEDRDGDRRESRRPLVPALDGLLEVVWSLLAFPEDLERMRADLEEKGACRASEYLAAVRCELPLRP